MRRSSAYLIDLAILLIPLLAGVWLLASTGFAPSLELGLVGLGALIFLAALYGLFLASMLSREGQSVGKRLTGLRVLSSSTGQAADLGSTVLRGAVFFAGILALGILPIITAIALIKKRPDAELSYHRLAGSRVLDIRAGVDPLNQEPAYYPPYPEQWASPAELAPIAVFPPAAPYASTHLAAPAVPDRGQTENAASQPKKAGAARWAVPLGQAVAMIAVLGLLSSGVAWGASALQPRPPVQGDSTEFSAAVLAQKVVPLSNYSGPGFPGYAQGPAWHQKVSPNAVTISVQAGTFIFDNRTLSILNNATGKKLSTQVLDGKVDVAQETEFDGERGLMWKIGNTLRAWTPKMGTKPALKVSIPAESKISAAGSNLMIQFPNGKIYTLTKTGLLQLTVPADEEAIGVDGNKLLSAKFSGPLAISSPNGKEHATVTLKAPQEGQQIVDWVTVGHGLAILTWSELPESKEPANPITVAVYREATGELLSTLPTTRARIDESPTWLRGQGFAWASYANYIYDLSTGWPILDVKAQGIDLSGIFADGIAGEKEQGPVFLQQDNSWIYAAVTPLAITGGGVIVRTKDNELQRFTSTG
nr:RDD family protein [Psychromicrobium silvestre]